MYIEKINGPEECEEIEYRREWQLSQKKMRSCNY